MATERGGHGCVINFHRNEIYVVGGENSKRRAMSSCEVYSINENAWRPMPNLNLERVDPSLVVLNKCFLYCFGGGSVDASNTIVHSNSIEVLYLETSHRKWFTL